MPSVGQIVRRTMPGRVLEAVVIAVETVAASGDTPAQTRVLFADGESVTMANVADWPLVDGQVTWQHVGTIAAAPLPI